MKSDLHIKNRFGTYAKYLILLFSISTIFPTPLLSQSRMQSFDLRAIYTATTTPAFPDLNNISALSYLVTKHDGTIILSKNETQQYPIASLTKLMTGIITLEKANIRKIVSVTKQMVTTFGDSGDLKAGDRVTIENLLFPLLMRSSNDATEAIAESLGIKNSRAVFIWYMNKKASSLQLKNTLYYDPSGLTPRDVSTVEDIEKLLRYIERQYPIILTLTTIKEYAQGKYVWQNSSSLPFINGFLGGKTGFTTIAQQTAAGIFLTKTSKTTIEPLHYVLLQSKDRNGDIELLRRYIEYRGE